MDSLRRHTSFPSYVTLILLLSCSLPPVVLATSPAKEGASYLYIYTTFFRLSSFFLLMFELRLINLLTAIHYISLDRVIVTQNSIISQTACSQHMKYFQKLLSITKNLCAFQAFSWWIHGLVVTPCTGEGGGKWWNLFELVINGVQEAIENEYFCGLY